MPNLCKICSGCSACATICPTEAITMDYNDGGSYTYTINESKCVNCQLCEHICPVLNDKGVPLSKENVYVSVVLNREILRRSSSGGVANVLAHNAIKQGKSVCAVTYNTQEERAEHIIINDTNDLYKIQGSKYLQSSNANAFRLISQQEQGVVFGTPCQIAGMDAVLKRTGKRDQFILVDIFCHGTPVQILWKQHLQWLRANKKIEGSPEVQFRNGKLYFLTIGSYHAWYNEDSFYTIFLRSMLNNKACYSCKFRRTSAADIRLGDCMSEKYKTLSFGPSCVIANTKNGEETIKSMSNDLELYEEAYSFVDSIQQSDNIELPLYYDEWIKKLNNGVYPENLINKTIKIGRLKSLIKNRLLGSIHSHKNDDLHRAVFLGK